ncbi:MAG: sortase [Chloroflexi bacterium]|nr:sortase [Chloroflexota bacterium]MCI0581257.1 sortase [Chloroflexota bacterium]MCI0644257.1 sortase [Chloroflexota bacterium]MCI0727576.1 sortase [Chloroflexota bacterium]
MPSPSSGPAQELKIPLGIVLVAIGLIVMLSAAIVWAISPSQMPALLERASVPPTPIPTATQPRSAVGDVTSVPILLPETPLLSASGELPSYATVEEAPKSYGVPIAGQPLRLIIPSLGIDAPVTRIGLLSVIENGQQFFQWNVPNGYTAGWHETSASLGQPGNTVLNGHNNIYGEIFRDLINLVIGEKVILYDVAGSSHTYEVTQQELLPENGEPFSVRLENARWIESTTDERVTLVSCWPYATNAYRLIVIARPIQQ